MIKNNLIKSNLAMAVVLTIPCSASAQLEHAIRDEQGRHVIPRGFVINTEDCEGNIYYTSNDYHLNVHISCLRW